MPPVSKRQARLFRAAAAGKARIGGLSREKAHEMVSGHSTKGLPESADRFKKVAAKRRAKRKGN